LLLKSLKAIISFENLIEILRFKCVIKFIYLIKMERGSKPHELVTVKPFIGISQIHALKFLNCCCQYNRQQDLGIFVPVPAV